jgi:predicted transposase/invertase (TIGR01784 family)
MTAQEKAQRDPMTEITNPHDRFFKEVFSRPEVAEDFLLHYLPPHVSGLLQTNTIRLHKDSFVDANLKEFFSDLLYQVDFREGRPAFVYILFEHKSYPAPDIAFQLLRYMTRIWEYSSKQAVGSLPPVIPIVLYHGMAKWRIPLNFACLYRAPESLKEILWDFSYYLCDLSAHTDGEIKLGAMATVALLLLKNIRSETLAERLMDVFGLLRAMTEQTALEFLETILRYLGAASETLTMEDCRKALEATFPETGEMYMDRWTEQLVAEHRQEWMKEGIREGMREGIKEGAVSLTIRLLIRKFGPLDSALEERVRQLSFEELERLGEELLDFQDESALAQWLERFGKSH